MHVIATAGHVDHGKSTLVRALTGMEPDRWAEERRRGMTIDLGFAWTTLPSGRTLAFVDVPGHERFVTNMLAGVGPAPMVMLVVAADEGWMAQTEEHMRVVAALGRAQVLLAVTKCDRAAPETVGAQALARLEKLGLSPAGVVHVSGMTGAGLDDLRDALEAFVRAQPAPPSQAPVRLWIDRAFTIRGAGTVVTGTLDAGCLHVGDTVLLAPDNRRVEVRGLQALQHQHDVVEARARVAVNLRATSRDVVARGKALVTPGAWTLTDHVDVIGTTDELPHAVVVHLGSAAVPAHRRRLGPGAARLRLREPLPMHVGDRLLLRDPASRRVAGVDVADLHPRPLARRGDAARTAAALAVPSSAQELVLQRGVCSVEEITAAGLDPAGVSIPRVGDWLVSPARWSDAREHVSRRVAAADDALSRGISLAALAHELDLPAPEIVAAVAADLPAVRVADGRLHNAAASVRTSTCLEQLLRRLETDPFDAPDTHDLTASGLQPAELARAVREGRLTRLAEGVYVAATALADAARLLAELPQPFSVSEARDQLGSSRRVVVPLLEQLDAARMTRRLPDGQRVVVRSEA